MNYLAFREMLCKRGEVARRLRLAVFAGGVLLMVVLVWFGLRAVAAELPGWVAAQERVQAEMQAEYEGLEAAYDAEMVEGALRAARLRDNGQAVAAPAWRVASETPATRKGAVR